MKTNCGSCYVSSTLIRTNRLLNVSLAKMCLFEISREWQFGVCKHGVCVRAQSLQLCLTLCDPMDCSLPRPPFLGLSRQEYWSGLPCPSLGDLPNPGIEPASPALAGRFFTAEPSVRLWQGPAFRRCPRFPCGSQLCPPRIQAVCVSPSSEFQRNNWSCYPSEGFIMGPPKVQSPG